MKMPDFIYYSFILFTLVNINLVNKKFYLLIQSWLLQVDKKSIF